jgi:hypothetical protein
MKINHLKWLRKAHDRLQNKEAPTVTELTEMPTKDEAQAPVDTENNHPNIEDVDYVQENIRANCNTGMVCIFLERCPCALLGTRLTINNSGVSSS